MVNDICLMTTESKHQYTVNAVIDNEEEALKLISGLLIFFNIDIDTLQQSVSEVTNETKEKN